jgi:hypothetical protein
MKDKVERFNRFELYIYKGYITLFGFGATVLLLMLLFEDLIINIFNHITAIFVVGVYYIIINFFVTLIHVSRYLFVFKDQDEVTGIKRSLIVLISSPITFGIYLTLSFALALSMASCS